MYQPPKPDIPKSYGMSLAQWRSLMDELYRITDACSVIREKMRLGSDTDLDRKALAMLLSTKQLIYEQELGIKASP